MEQCFSQLKKNIKIGKSMALFIGTTILNSRILQLHVTLKKKGKMIEDIGRRRELTKREKKSRRDLGAVPSAIGQKTEEGKRGFRQRNVVIFQAKLTFTNRMARTLHCKSHTILYNDISYLSLAEGESEGNSLSPSEWYTQVSCATWKLVRTLFLPTKLRNTRPFLFRCLCCCNRKGQNMTKSTRSLFLSFCLSPQPLIENSSSWNHIQE